MLKSNLSQTESEPDISLLCETSPLCKTIYTAELISSPQTPVQVQSEDSEQEQPTEPSSSFHPQLIQQSTAVPNFPSSGNAIMGRSPNYGKNSNIFHITNGLNSMHRK